MRRFRVEQSHTLEAPGGRIEAWVAESFRARLLGLAGLAAVEPGRALVIPRCRSVHTFGMRFPIDVAFVGWPTAAPRGAVLALHEAVGAMRVQRLGGGGVRGVAALEAPAGTLAALGVRPGTSLLPVRGRLLTSGRERQRADRGLAGPR